MQFSVNANSMSMSLTLLRAEQSDHDIAIVLEKDSVQMSAGQTAWLGDLIEQLLLDLFVLPTN